MWADVLLLALVSALWISNINDASGALVIGNPPCGLPVKLHWQTSCHSLPRRREMDLSATGKTSVQVVL